MSGTKKSKSASAPASSATFSVGDTVLGYIKGYPKWPGKILEHEKAPPTVQRVKPAKSKGAHLVRFFPTGDFAWLSPDKLEPLTSVKINAWIDDGGKKKGGELYKAYLTAQDPTAWENVRDSIVEDAPMDDEEGDELASEGEEGTSKAGKNKRKRKDEGKAEKPKKGEAKGKKSNAKKSSATVQSEDEGSAPPNKKAKSNGASAADGGASGVQLVKDWRHKLQRTFLNKDDKVIQSDLPNCVEYFDAMEKFDMKQEWLTETKLGKVLKRIAQLKDGLISGEEQYGFRKRAHNLAAKWANAPASNGAAAAEGDAAPSGSAQPEEKMDVEEGASADKEEPKAEEPAAVGKDEVEMKKDAEKDEEKKEDTPAAPAPAEAETEKEKEEAPVAAPATEEEKKDDPDVKLVDGEAEVVAA